MPRFKSNKIVTQRHKQELDYLSNCIAFAKTKLTRKTPDWMIRTPKHPFYLFYFCRQGLRRKDGINEKSFFIYFLLKKRKSSKTV